MPAARFMDRYYATTQSPTEYLLRQKELLTQAREGVAKRLVDAEIDLRKVREELGAIDASMAQVDDALNVLAAAGPSKVTKLPSPKSCLLPPSRDYDHS